MRRQIAVASIALTTACGGPSHDSGVVVRDSAGITIVENLSPVWGHGEGWQVAAAPTVTIGVLEGPEEYQLFRVRSAVRLQDGRIVIANAGSYELRFYDADGGFSHAVGGQGGGPGEFERFMGAIWRANGDSLVIYDYINSMRLSVFDANGTFGRTFRLDASSTSIPLADDLIWGDAVVSRSALYDSDDVGDGLRRDSAMYCLHSLTGEVLDTLGRFPGSELYAQNMGEGNTLAISRPFGRSPQSAATAEYWYFGSGDRYEIEGYGRSGALERLLRRNVANRPVTQDQLDELSHRGSGTGVWREIPIPETMPAYGQFLGDADGNLWVQEYRVGDEPEHWAVFDPRGRFLGIVEMPGPGRVTEIGSDYVLGVWTDELDVEQVRLYGLERDE